MSLPDHLVALRDEAMRTSCDRWARNKGWKLSLGVDRAGPCPNCGGTDRFSIHVKNNVFSCRQCGLAGRGAIKLVQDTQGVGFTEACEIIVGRKADAPFDRERADRIAEENAADELKRVKEAESYRQKARREGYEIWQARSTDRRRPAVLAYLRIRGLLTSDLMAVYDEIRLGQHDSLPYMEKTAGGWVSLARTLAMIAAVQQPDGRFGAVHRTWLDLDHEKGRLQLDHPDTGKALETKKVWGIKQGGAIRLYTPANPRFLIMGEGIETTLTPLAYNFEPDTAYWAGVDVGNMSGKARRDENGKAQQGLPDLEDLDCFQPPEWCERLTYLGETEKKERNTDLKLTRGLLRAQHLRNLARQTNPSLPLLETDFVEPPEQGGDLNDIVREET